MPAYRGYFWLSASVAALGLACASAATAQSRGEIVALPNGDTVAIGAEGGLLLQAHDAGRLEGVLWQLLDEGRPGDAVAVLAYVARHRAAAAGALAVMGLRIVTDLQDTAGAGEMVSAILRESGADAIAVRAAVRAAGLPAEVVDTAALRARDGRLSETELAERVAAEGAEVASLEPASQYLPAGDAPPGPGELSIPADLPSGARSYGAHGGERPGFGGGGLPPGLVIGGGGAGGGRGNGNAPPDIKDPPPDAGVS